jgi:hypothetical protein
LKVLETSRAGAGDEVEVGGGDSNRARSEVVLDVHVGLGVIEPADPDEIITSSVIACLDERFPRGGAGGVSPLLDLVELLVRDGNRIRHAASSPDSARSTSPPLRNLTSAKLVRE